MWISEVCGCAVLFCTESLCSGNVFDSLSWVDNYTEILLTSTQSCGWVFPYTSSDFVYSLLEHCRKHKYLSASGEVFALLVSSLLENLLDYRTIMHDESKENRMSCTVNVLVWGRLEVDVGASFLTSLLRCGPGVDQVPQNKFEGLILPCKTIHWKSNFFMYLHPGRKPSNRRPLNFFFKDFK